MVGSYSQGLNRRKICRQVATPPQSSQEPLHPRFVLSGCKPPTKPVRRIAARQPLSLWQPDEAEVDGGHATSKFVGQRWKRHRSAKFSECKVLLRSLTQSLSHLLSLSC